MKLIHKQFIFNDPTPTPECHASTIVKTNDGHLIAAWFAGEKEGKNDVMIWTSFFENGVWSSPQVASIEYDIPHWNPVLFQTDDQTVCLFYKIGYRIPDWQTMYTLTKDGGRTWSEPKELIAGDTSGGRGPVKNKAIRISNGQILAPASTEKGPWRPFIDLYKGNGEWEKIRIPVELPDAEKINLIQPTLWESSEGHIHALMRSNQHRIYRSDSADSGRTWSNVYPTSMPNNNSGLDCTMLDDSKLVLVCNPIDTDWGKRSPLSVFVSADNGQTFKKVLDLETEDGEFSYPAVIHSEDRIYVTYTWNRKKIVFCELERF